MKYIFILLFVYGPSSFAWETTPVPMDIPLVDMPYNGQSYFPNLYSMNQSLALSTDYYQGFHSLLAGERSPENRWRIWLVLGFDVASTYFPFSNSWLHEEWHRSVMAHRGIGSFNDVNLVPIGSSLIAVSHVADQDLVRLKRDHPADQVRLNAAGMESEIYQNHYIEKLHFFGNVKSRDVVLLWLNKVGVISYLNTCSSKEADKSTDQQNMDDGSDMIRRDFTGLDCTAWAYDLFRPDEPYTARGVHPSGNGIDRYIRYSDLSEKEKDFLALQRNLSLLNLVDPFLINFEDFSFGDWKWNANLSHYITSFGGDVDAHLFLKKDTDKYLITFHYGMTDTRIFPGLSFEKIDMPLSDSFSLSSGITVWQQPRGQRVEETASETVVDGTLMLNYKINPTWMTYVGLEAKTPGWIAGNVALDRDVSARAGARAWIF